MALGRDKADNKTETPEREITGFSRTLDILGDAPILLILESYWLGTRRFDAFVRQTGLIKTVVSDRLARLVDQGFMQKVRYSERPERFEYRGCDKLNDLFSVALCMLHWEKAWGRKSDVTHVRLTHVNCGEESDPYPVCCVCDEDVQARDVAFNISASDLHGSYARRRRQTRATDARMGPTTLMDDIIRIMGDRWSALILLSVQNEIRGFQDIGAFVGVSSNILSDRLKSLCSRGVLRKRPRGDDARAVEYGLTPKGQAIVPILAIYADWGERWLGAGARTENVCRHRLCDQALSVKMVCSACGESVGLGDMQFELIDANPTS